MKKRILSLLMCAVLLLTGAMAASCGGGEGNLQNVIDGKTNEGAITDLPGRPHMTISIYSIRGKSADGTRTTDEAIAEVEKALSAIALRRFNTSIDLILIDEEEYAEQMFAKVKSAVQTYNAKLLKNDMKLSKDERDKILNSNVDYNDNVSKAPYGVKVSTNLDPEVLNAELDIFLVMNPKKDSPVLDPNNKTYYNEALTKYTMFELLCREEALAPLSTMLNGTFAPIKSEVYTQALEFATRKYVSSNGQIYGVPNTYIYGDYEYVVFNQKYIKMLYGDTADLSSFATDSAKLRTLIEELTEKQKNFDDPDDTSAFDYKNVEMTFTDTSAVATAFQTNEFAIGYINGPKSIETIIESEHKNALDVIAKRINEVTDYNQFCDSMFCVGKPALYNNSERLSRCMEIMQLIQTNKEFRNIFQYGVEGTHYTQFGGSDVTPIPGDKLESQYFMDREYTGNVFLLYPSTAWDKEDYAMAENGWALAKEQVYDLLTAPNKDRDKTNDP